MTQSTTTARCRTGWRSDLQRRGRNGVAVGGREEPRDGRRPVRRRGRADLARERRSPWRARHARSSSSAIRSSSTSRCRAHIRPARIGRRWRTCSAGTTPCPRPGAVPRAHLAAPSIGHRVHVDRPSTRASSRRDRTSRASGSAARSRCAGPASAWSRPITSAPTASRRGGAPGRALVRALVESRSTWIDARRRGAPARRTTDVLIVAPYNAQVGAIAALLPPEARVGTVDKFQGQEAPVSIYSMTSSSPEDAPRGMYVPLLPQPAERRDVARAMRRRSSSRSPRCSVSERARPSRCAWPTRCASSPRAVGRQPATPESMPIAGPRCPRRSEARVSL